MNWWEQKPKETESPRPRAVAYYRHSAQDRQENSIPLQQEQVRAWAEQWGVDIIQEFFDAGKSGLTAEDRPSFNDMMENWVCKRDDFEYVLCLDVSRWGRFQDIDLSAQYSAECKRHGKFVVYTTIGLPREDDPLYPVYVQFERFRAAQYSKELSDKVFRGCRRIAEQGYSPGGSPPFGMSRLLLDESRQPVKILAPGEHKSIQNQRVTLTPSGDAATDIVLRIFREFTESGAQLEQIADSLNEEGIRSPGGAKWDADKVRHILTNEKYIGTLVYNQTTQKLKTPTRKNPEEAWVRTAEAFAGLVSPEVFEQARAILNAAVQQYESATMLERLGALMEEHGFICPSMVKTADGLASPSTFADRFGSLSAAIQLLFAESHAAIRDQVQHQIQELAEHVEPHEDFLVINGRFTVLVQPSVPVPFGLSQYWYFAPDQRKVVDITLGVPVSAPKGGEILGYLVFPRLLTSDRRIKLFGSSESRLELFGHHGLGVIEQLVRWRTT